MFLHTKKPSVKYIMWNRVILEVALQISLKRDYLLILFKEITYCAHLYMHTHTHLHCGNISKY